MPLSDLAFFKFLRIEDRWSSMQSGIFLASNMSCGLIVSVTIRMLMKFFKPLPAPPKVMNLGLFEAQLEILASCQGPSFTLSSRAERQMLKWISRFRRGIGIVASGRPRAFRRWL